MMVEHSWESGYTVGDITVRRVSRSVGDSRGQQGESLQKSTARRINSSVGDGRVQHREPLWQYVTLEYNRESQ